MEAREPVVRQTTITLPYFEQELPAMYMADGTGYIPVIALCQMLGLHAATHIARWRRLMIWSHARKLPLRTVRGRRIVWLLAWRQHFLTEENISHDPNGLIVD